MTINKVQGQTSEKVGIYLPKPVYSHGQLCVAVLGARALGDVKVKVHNTPNQGYIAGKTITCIIVYRDAP